MCEILQVKMGQKRSIQSDFVVTMCLQVAAFYKQSSTTFLTMLLWFFPFLLRNNYQKGKIK